MNLVDILFPKSCLVCKRNDYFLCPYCVRDATLVKQTCIECERSSVDGFTHTKCIRPWGLDGVVSVWVYEKIIREAILKLKYKFAYKIADELAGYVTHYLKTNVHALPSKAVLIPVPLHKMRERWRGFNQAGEIGAIIAKYMDWNYRPDLVIRKFHTAPQVELRGSQRQKNLKDVFGLKHNYRLPGQNYILFDDVMTTGTTLKEVGKVLKRGGAERVWGLTITR